MGKGNAHSLVVLLARRQAALQTQHEIFQLQPEVLAFSGLLLLLMLKLQFQAQHAVGKRAIFIGQPADVISQVVQPLIMPFHLSPQVKDIAHQF